MLNHTRNHTMTRTHLTYNTNAHTNLFLHAHIFFYDAQVSFALLGTDTVTAADSDFSNRSVGRDSRGLLLLFFSTGW